MVDISSTTRYLKFLVEGGQIDIETWEIDFGGVKEGGIGDH